MSRGGGGASGAFAPDFLERPKLKPLASPRNVPDFVYLARAGNSLDRHCPSGFETFACSTKHSYRMSQ